MLLQFIVFVMVMLLLLYGKSFFAGATRSGLEKMGKSTGGVAALVFALVLFMRGHMEMAIAVGGFGLFLLGYLSNHKWADMFRGLTGAPPETGGEPPPSGQQSMARRSAMSVDEAYDVLGLAKDASREDIAGAHRRLMKKLHPDLGETSNLAVRVNEARDVLLNGRG